MIKLLLGGDDHVAFGLAVVAHALHGVDLGQLVDDLAMFSVHGRETVAPLWLFSLQTPLKSVLKQSGRSGPLDGTQIWRQIELINRIGK